MKIVLKKDAININNSNTCLVTEYPINEQGINGSVISVEGRYPENGFAVNEVCKELVYITKGGGVIVLSGATQTEFQEGDSLFIDVNEEFYWEGSFESFMVCTPAFYPEQHKIIEE